MKQKINDRKIPSLDEFCAYIEAHGFDIDPYSLYREFNEKGWVNQKGQPTRSWTALVAARNSVICQHERKKEQSRLGVTKKNKREKKQKTEICVSKAKTKDVRMHYDEYLRDKRWFAFRKFVFSVRGCACEKCHATEHLQVHHIKYKEGLYPWEYSCKEVMILCDKCHAKVHGYN